MNPETSGAAPGDGVTMGVEEEFLLVDPATGHPAPGFDAVCGRLPGVPGVTFVGELHPTQIEAVGGVCRTLAELRTRLTSSRSALDAAARRCGLRFAAVGVPESDAGPGTLVAAGRRAAIAERYRALVDDYHACGCHVHVGVADRDTAAAVVNHLTPWLPTLVALGANSPRHGGRDTGYASWRIVQQSRFPGFGLPPYLRSAQHAAALVARLVDAGVLLDSRMTFWLARPSVHVPTVEIRAADTAPTVDGTVLQAALGRGLVGAALDDLRRGVEVRPVEPDLGAAAVWSAARYGLDGPAVDVHTGTRIPARDMLARLLDRVAPTLRAHGDLDVVQKLLAGPRPVTAPRVSTG